MLMTEREWDTLFDQARDEAGWAGIVGFQLLDAEDGGAVVTCNTMRDVYVFFAAAGSVLDRADSTELARSATADTVYDSGSPNGFVRLTLRDLQVTDSLTGARHTTPPQSTEDELLDRIMGRRDRVIGQGRGGYTRPRTHVRDLDQSDVDADGERAAE